MAALDARLAKLLAERQQKNRYRSLKEYDTSTDSGLVDFSSNDYLSLTASKALRAAYIKRLQDTPSIFGSTGSRLLSGGTIPHRKLEDRFAQFFHSPAALLFNSGFDANVSFFSTVPQKDDWIIYDELVHASVHDGMRISRVRPDRRIPFTHNDPEGLREVLQRITRSPESSKEGGMGGTVFMAVESLYSMDGDLALLPALLDVLDEFVKRERQCVVVDEAHTTGLYGPGGRGMVYALGEEAHQQGKQRGKGRVDVRLMTFGKGVGSSGAVLLCTPTIRSFLINFARPLIFSTALPHSTLIALDCAWDILSSDEGDQRRQSLQDLAIYTHSLLEPLLKSTSPKILALPPSPTVEGHPENTTSNPFSPIIGLLTPQPHKLSAYLLSHGYIVRPVVPPTVPAGKERVRICLRADMRKEVIEGLVGVLRKWVESQSPESESSGSSHTSISGIRKREEIAVRAKL